VLRDQEVVGVFVRLSIAPLQAGKRQTCGISQFEGKWRFFKGEHL
jgi:hypothetical protein